MAIITGPSTLVASRALRNCRSLRLVVLPAILLSCGTPCYQSTHQGCKQAGTASTTAPARFIDPACRLGTSWEASRITFGQWCTREASWSVEITLPYGGGPASYAVPSSAVRIYANFVTATEYYGTDLLPPTLKVASGTILVTTRNAEAGEASVEIVLEDTLGESFSVAAHVSYGDCKPVTTTICQS